MTIRNIIERIFFVVFIALLVIPLLFTNHSSNQSDKEKRILTALPPLIIDNRINSDLFIQTDNYIKDRFGFRDEIVHLNAIITYNILKKRGNQKALIGKDDWYFYTDKKDGNNLSDFLKTNLPDTTAQLIFIDQIKARAHWCEKNNITFIFIIAPNKHSVYPEKYPFNRPIGKNRADVFIEHLKKLQINYIYPRDYLISKKDSTILYHTKGTHWNQYAGYYMYYLLLDLLKKEIPHYSAPHYTFNFTFEEMEEKDIYYLLGFSEVKHQKSFSISIQPKFERWQEIYTIENKHNDGYSIRSKHNKLPRALIYRDSFFKSLLPFMSLLFSEADCRWRWFSESEKNSILSNKPDVIIWEISERYLDGIGKEVWKE